MPLVMCGYIHFICYISKRLTQFLSSTGGEGVDKSVWNLSLFSGIQ